MHKDCIQCDIKQSDKIKKMLSLDSEKECQLNEIIASYLKTVDMRKTNPEVMGELWSKISEYLGNQDPYKSIKTYYNLELMKYENHISNLIYNSSDKFKTALKISIVGNLIDFSSNHTFDINTLLEMIDNILNNDLAIDDSLSLFNELKEAKNVLYLADNCGEIVLDKIFIRHIKKLFPKINVYYGVRGAPIVNDVTLEDAKQVNMQEVATIISNGDIALGTVLNHTSFAFRNIFDSSDVIISKGQGNYEGLLGNNKKNLFFLFMAKCNLIASPLHIPKLSIVCMQNKKKRG